MSIDVTTISTEEQSRDIEDIVNGNGTPTTQYLSQLRTAARPIVDGIASDIHNSLGLICEVSNKRDATAQDKCTRPATLKKYPWFSLAHIRDYLRFRTHCSRTADFAQVIGHFVNLQNAGQVRIVKIDTAKLLTPGAFGWRMVATDLRILGPDLLVEHYMTFGDMIQVNEQWLHAVYERWRSRATDTMTLNEMAQFNRDARFSRHANRELLHDGILKGQRASSPLPGARRALNQRIVETLEKTLIP